ncbi:outer membrane lipoprotein carrier protein LolA [Rhodoblastus acidophilus]|uniref:Outer membrane lipoprotein carrier protein LolA n=1 Tax=Candidatus Rhodoblastus alkanivorans TaxID=2954117 RepID=A0ABS9Z1H9_9HYPH|nr:outer-membrane lipoprotein carrier protein LolA [Candidatus Rhodoblastus alkanivorans]MCI4680927.1 outer membrane lipoprotein carrier protein LolA [Candidatus Rhodoblastus alkanivorans]MCI4681477.1 outer membrane lipoprotein carrier protein LolA [Candidatus Rhodoblastus alkanivorans]
MQGFRTALIGATIFVTTNCALAQKHPALTSRATKAAPQPVAEQSVPLDPQLAIQMANDYFNAAHVMTADFVQVGADGRRSEGKLYVLKPGRLRFEYALPATMEIIADGVSVAIRDRKLQTQQLYFISQTPLKFLLKDKLHLSKDVKVTGVTSNDKSTIITIEDDSTFGGTSIIKLNFDRRNFTLQQWEVTDPQGYETLVTLHNVDLKTTPDPKLFRIPPTNFWPSRNN